MSFDIQVVHSVSEIDPASWNRLSAGRPFQSHRWYEFGERVMADCLPVYIILSQNGQAVTRGTFWLVRNEPLPVPVWLGRLISPVFRRWPLLICRSPISNSSGLILPDPPLRDDALEAISVAALDEAFRLRASIVVFDYLNQEAFEAAKWPAEYVKQVVGDPGSMLEIVWLDFESYLSSLSPKTRKNYRRYFREAGRRDIKIVHHSSTAHLEEARTLIQNVERRYGNLFNPWFVEMVKYFSMVGGVMLTVETEGKVVGCELILGDGDEQLVTALGLDYAEPDIYFLLNFADIRYAIESGTRLLHWGSGAFDVKRRLGFQIERNDYVVFSGVGAVTKLISRLAGRLL